jgi:hypothetical protein
MKLNCFERIIALQVLASYKEGNFVTFKLLNELRNKLGFNEDETKEFDIKEIPGGEGKEGTVKWNEKGNLFTEIELTEGEIELIKKPLIKLDEENKLMAQHFTLYQKFVLDIEVVK